MLKFKEFSKKWYNYTVAFFTVIVLCFCLAGYCINAEANVMFSSQLLQLFAFSVVSSLCICISDFIQKNTVVKQAVRFVLVYASFALFFFALGAGRSFMMGQSSNKFFTFICMTLFFVGVYVVVSALIYAFSSIKNKIQEGKSEYKNQFDDVKNKEVK